MRGVADGNIRLMILGLSAMTTFLLIRSMYRTVELSDGWTGVIISTQWLFSSSNAERSNRCKVLIIHSKCRCVGWCHDRLGHIHAQHFASWDATS